MRGTCGVYGRRERYIQSFGRENLRKRDLLEYLPLDRRIILKRICKEQDGDDEDWINMAHSGQVLGFFEHGNKLYMLKVVNNKTVCIKKVYSN